MFRTSLPSVPANAVRSWATLDERMMKHLIIGIVLIAVVAIVFYVRHQKMQAEPNKPSASIVLLLSEPFVLEEHLIRTALTKAFGSDFSTNVDGRIVLPVIETAQYMVWTQGAAFILHNVPTGYFPDSDTVARTIEGDDALANNVRQHAAWLSFDVMSSELPLDEQYDLIGPVLAELAPTQTIAIFVLEKGVLIRFDSERKEQLRGPKVLQRLGFK